MPSAGASLNRESITPVLLEWQYRLLDLDMQYFREKEVLQWSRKTKTPMPPALASLKAAEREARHEMSNALFELCSLDNIRSLPDADLEWLSLSSPILTFFRLACAAEMRKRGRPVSGSDFERMKLPCLAKANGQDYKPFRPLLGGMAPQPSDYVDHASRLGLTG